jgi:hypothetical protein
VGSKIEEGDWNPVLNAVVISSKEFGWKHTNYRNWWEAMNLKLITNILFIVYVLVGKCTKYIEDEVLMAVNAKIMILWDVALHSLVGSFLQNAGTCIPKYTASHPGSAVS